MGIVTDACVAGAWALPDEDVELANAVLRMAPARGLMVPALWWFEVRNLLVIQERRQRLTEGQSTAFLADLRQLPIGTDNEPGEAMVMSLARRLSLTVYDAAYLELAKRRSLPLATLDRRLATAAATEGVMLFTA
jgi:predicted nucleic acid-binding protein